MRWFITLLLMVVMSMTGTLLNSTNHGYQVSFASAAGTINSTSHNYSIVVGIPSSKQIQSTNNEYEYGMLTDSNLSVVNVCTVTDGSGSIVSQIGTSVNVTMVFNNVGSNNITCVMDAINGQCNYIATNISYMTEPYSPINNLTTCSIILTTNSTTDTRRITLDYWNGRLDWGKVISGATVVISLIGIYIGWEKVSEEL